MSSTGPSQSIDASCSCSVNPEATKKSSYGQILRSSSIVGGAQGINYFISMVRTKLVAVLLGPSGVGLVGLYVSAMDLIGTLTRLGINESGVREVAEAYGSGDSERIARTVKTLRRVCWVTGVLGWLLTAALSYPLSVWTFDSGDRAGAMALLGATLLLGAVCGGRTALIQGTRRIGDLARLNVLGAIASALAAVGLYAWLGEQGIVPVLIVTAALNLSFAWWFSRRIQTIRITQTWLETLKNSKQMMHLGMAFMYGAVLAAIVGLVIRALVLRQLGLDANGIYQAAWGISGVFAGFVINAMGADFYPRLTSVSSDNSQVNRLVNEQIEIGILLVLPGILCTLIFSPELLRVFYSHEFLPGAKLLPWFAIGVYVQVIIFPLGYIQRAKGAVRWIFVGQTFANTCHIGLVILLIPLIGIEGASYAYLGAVLLQSVVVYCIAKHLSCYTCSPEVVNLTLASGCLILVASGLKTFSGGIVAAVLGAILIVLSGAFSLRGIAHRLGFNHWAIRLVCRFPPARILMDRLK